MNKPISAYKILGRLARSRTGVAAVTFALVFPVLLTLSLGIMEFALAAMDRHQVSEALRLFTRTVAISTPVVDLSNLNDAPQECDMQAGNNGQCGNGTQISSPDRLSTAFARAQAIYPHLQESNIVIRYTASGLAPVGSATGIMALVTVEFRDINYDARIFPLVNGVISQVLFPDMSMSLVAGG